MTTLGPWSCRYSQRIKVPRDAMPNVQHTSPELRTLISSLPDALIVQIDELIAFANPAFLKLIGAEDANQVVGRHMRDFIHPRYLASDP